MRDAKLNELPKQIFMLLPLLLLLYVLTTYKYMVKYDTTEAAAEAAEAAT